MGCIYRIVNKIDGKSYIGQSIYDNPSRRWNTHKSNHINEKYEQYLYRAMRKYGIDNFEFIKICICSREELDTLECTYIKEYNTFGDGGYNMTTGGQGTRDYKASDETRKKISQAGKGRIPSEETRKKLSIANMGHTVSEETREKLRKASTGVIKRPETIKKLKEISSNRVVKQTTREKLRKNMLGKPKSEEHVKNIKAAKRKFSEDEINYIRNNPDRLLGKDLAIKFNTSKTSISRIINNKRYV